MAGVTFPRWRDRVPTSGCLVSQPPRLLTIPEPRQGAGEKEIPLYMCVSVAHAPRGGASGHTMGWCLALLWGGVAPPYGVVGCPPPLPKWLHNFRSLRVPMLEEGVA